MRKKHLLPLMALCFLFASAYLFGSPVLKSDENRQNYQRAPQEGTNVSGTISSNTTWPLAGSPYTVTGNITVNPNVTLTIQPGVVVQFNQNRYIEVRGTMNANEVTFTGNMGVTKGFWDGLYVSYTSYGPGTINLTNSLVEYAKNINIRKGELTVTGSQIRDLSGSILIQREGELTIDNTEIKDCNYPIVFEGPGKLNTGENLVFDNVNDYININFSALNQDFELSEEIVPYYVSSDLTVSSGSDFQIGKGVVLNFANYNRITVSNGSINAIGTEDEPIVFQKNVSANYYWYGITINGNENDAGTILKHCIIRDTANSTNAPAIRLINSSASVENCEFSNNYYNLVLEAGGSPVISNSLFGETRNVSANPYNITMEASVMPQFTNNTIEFNDKELRGIAIKASTISGKEVELKKLNFNGIENITYILNGSTTVAADSKWEIEPGVVMKWGSYSYEIRADGQFIAIGTEAEPIVFTSLADDNYGNPLDTENDGVKNVSINSGGRIYMQSIDAVSKIEKCKVLYGGYSTGYRSVYAYENNVINDCEIKYSTNGVYYQKNAVVSNNLFEGTTYPLNYGISNGNPVLSGNTLVNVSNHGIVLYDQLIDNEVTLKKVAFAGMDNTPFILNNTLKVTANQSLTIEPGVIVKSLSFGSQAVLVDGKLQAIGTKNEKIIFTSIHDDSVGGDTNNNGTSSIPENNDWRGISFSNLSNGKDNVLKNLEIHYSGNSYVDGSTTYAPLGISNSDLLIDSVLINASYYYGIAVFGNNAAPEIKNTTFRNISGEPVYMDMFSNPTFEENISLVNTPNVALRIRGGTVEGTVPLRNFAGYYPITYITAGTMTINNELTIPAGLTFKGEARWNVNGKINILGTTADPVVFTTYEDDDYGVPADSQSNGNTSRNQYGSYFVFSASSNDASTITNAIFKYANAIPIQLTNSAPTISNNYFGDFSKVAVSLKGNSAPLLDNNTFNNLSFPIEISTLNYPASTNNNVISGSTGRGILIINETLTQDATLQKRDFAGYENIPYVLSNYTVGSSAKLTIQPGVILKFLNNGQLNVRNGLIANGGNNIEDAIIFTSIYDDFYGGDTQNNGVTSLSDRGWYGIMFYEESVDADCIINNSFIKHASYQFTAGTHRGAVTLESSSPTITNTRFENNLYGVFSRGASFPVIENCDFSSMNPSSSFALLNQNNAVTLTAENCWFGHESGPRHASNPDGEGERVSDYVEFTPFASSLQKAAIGDVSYNGSLTSYDASLILQHVVGNINLSNKQQEVADVNSSGSINSLDASWILQYNVGLIYSFAQAPSPFLAPRFVQGVEDNGVRFGMAQFLGNSDLLRLPLYFNTGADIVSADLQIMFDTDQLQLLGLSKENIAPEISFAHTDNLNTGKLNLSMASAYDLQLDDGVVYLDFSFTNPNTSESKILLSSAYFNDYRLDTDDISQMLINKLPTAVSSHKAGKLNLWQEGDRIMFTLPAELLSENIVVKVADITGKMVYSDYISNLDDGQFSISLKDTQIIKNGVYLIQVNSGDKYLSEKLIINKK